jgi:dihydrofolate reductase
MRKVCVLTFTTLDGVMQSPGGPEEDTGDSFELGGWLVGYFDEHLNGAMSKQMGHPYDLLLGRRTYEIFASHWPKSTDPGADGINTARKFVATHRPLSFDWNKTATRLDGDVAEAVRQLKHTSGPELQVHGSGRLIQTLLANDLVDELWLKIFPVTLGSGQRLFAEGTRSAGLELIEHSASPSGVIVANYRRAGAIKSGTLPS